MNRAKAVGILIVLLTLPFAGQQPPNAGASPHSQSQPQHQKSGGPKGPPKLGTWLRAHKDLPLDQQIQALQNDPDFKHRSPQVQASLKERLEKFNSLPQQQKEKALRNMEFWDRLTGEQKEQVRQAHLHMQTLPTERKVMVRKELHTLRTLPRDARQQRLQSDEFKTTFSDQEQTILKNLAEINPPAQ